MFLLNQTVGARQPAVGRMATGLKNVTELVFHGRSPKMEALNVIFTRTEVWC